MNLRPPRRTFIPALVMLNLFVLSPMEAHGQTTATAAVVKVGSIPLGLTYDAGKGEVFVANNGNGSISVILDATNAVVAKINLGSNSLPRYLAYDSAKGEIFVTSQYGADQKVYIISDATNSLVGTIPWPSPSVAGLALDSGKGEIFVANPGAATQNQGGGLVSTYSPSIFVISDATDLIVAEIGLATTTAKSEGPIPIDMVYDSGKGEVFVANAVYNYTTGQELASTVSVISDATNSVIANIDVGGGVHAEGLAYDPAKGEVFVANSNGTNLTVVSDATNAVVASVRVEAQSTGHQEGSGLLGVAYDSAKEEVVVANNGDYLPNTISAISDATNVVVAKVSVGHGPAGITYDSGKGEVLVANSGEDTVSVIPDAFLLPEFPMPFAVPVVLFVTLVIAICAGSSKLRAKQSAVAKVGALPSHGLREK